MIVFTARSGSADFKKREALAQKNNREAATVNAIPSVLLAVP